MRFDLFANVHSEEKHEKRRQQETQKDDTAFRQTETETVAPFCHYQ